MHDKYLAGRRYENYQGGHEMKVIMVTVTKDRTEKNPDGTGGGTKMRYPTAYYAHEDNIKGLLAWEAAKGPGTGLKEDCLAICNDVAYDALILDPEIEPISIVDANDFGRLHRPQKKYILNDEDAVFDALYFEDGKVKDDKDRDEKQKKSIDPTDTEPGIIDNPPFDVVNYGVTPSLIDTDGVTPVAGDTP